MRKQHGSPSSLGVAGQEHGGPDPASAGELAPSAGAAGSNTLSGLEDRLLAIRAGEGDDEAFAVLVLRHSALLLALARHLLGSPEDAEDAVQDAFLSAWRRLPEFRGDATFRTWMYRIVTNRCLNILRSRSRDLPLDTVPEPTTATTGAAPERAAESDAATVALVQALGELSPDQRACWVLRELHGLRYKEISPLVGASEQTVRGRLFRARRILMKEMGPWR
ncbi:RNA polymerase sigma factor [Streptomyces sp. NBC_00046]|uniref:RNA polymerase sigma factor n=1 Tax=unclassified Streptomyces TaxID=2593676 RepID=UPI00324382E1